MTAGRLLRALMMLLARLATSDFLLWALPLRRWDAMVRRWDVTVRRWDVTVHGRRYHLIRTWTYQDDGNNVSGRGVHRVLAYALYGLVRRAVLAAVEQMTLLVCNWWACALAAGFLSCGQRGGSFPQAMTEVYCPFLGY